MGGSGAAGESVIRWGRSADGQGESKMLEDLKGVWTKHVF